MIEAKMTAQIKADGESYVREVHFAYDIADPFVIKMTVQPAGSDGDPVPWDLCRDMLYEAVMATVASPPIGEGDVKMATTSLRVLIFLHGSGNEAGEVASIYVSRPELRRFVLRVRDVVPPGEEYRFYSIDDVCARLLGEVYPYCPPTEDQPPLPPMP